MTYQQSIAGCLSSKIASHGLTDARLAHWLDKLTTCFDALNLIAREGNLPHFKILDDDDGLLRAKSAYDTLAQGAETIVVLGTGGSSLGGQALAQLGGWSIPGDNGPSGRKGPRLRFYDNLDERSYLSGLRILNFETTRFVVISKSGTTGETLAQTLTAFALIEKAGHSALIPKLFLGVTEPARPGVSNGLRDLFGARGIPILDHPTDIGGRYSVFSTVGLIPGFARGLDMAAFRNGARETVQALAQASSPEDHPAAVGAAVAIGLAKDLGVTNSIMMPYSPYLGRLSAWYVQLWAESLGKGGEGTMPIAALGPVDQHSQLQMFMDGPRTHMLTIVRVGGHGSSHDAVAIPKPLADEAGASYLGNRTIGDLVRAQQNAIVDALLEVGRPVRTIDIPVLDERAMGALMMNFMIETILAADLLGVDPFDQPGVELGKTLTRQYLAQ